MDEIINAERIERWLAEARVWVEAEILAYEALLQLGVILAGFALAWFLRRSLRAWLVTRKDFSWSGRFVRLTGVALGRAAGAIIWFAVVWLGGLLWEAFGWRHHILVIAESLLVAWIVIQIASLVIRNRFWSRVAAGIAWIIAALNIFGLLGPATELLADAVITIGDVSVSALTIVKTIVILILLIWLAVALAKLIDYQVRRSEDLTPSSKELVSKATRIVLILIAFFIGLDAAGLDLSSLALFGGALGVGLGFGLQKVVSNFVSGIILLADKSIKPGDVIALDEMSYGWIQSLNARYVSVRTRDGAEILIPNEELITSRVENWSHSNQLVRVRIPLGISYDSDLERAIELCVSAAEDTPRVHAEPAPRCLIRGFGDSSVDLELRIWITDPQEGRANVSSEVYLRIWKLFKEHDIRIPYPQRDLHVRSVSEDAAEAVSGTKRPGGS